MCAAVTGSRETLETLLHLGADPDILNSADKPALYAAIQSGDQVITDRLAQITNNGEADRQL